MLSRIDSDPLLRGAFSEGKMLGVMLAEDSSAEIHTLYAFSGSVTVPGPDGRPCLSNFLPGFVPPVCDLLDPEGRFKSGEREISELNFLIHKAEKAGNPSPEAAAELERMKSRRRELSEYLQKWIFDHYELLNARGERRSISSLAESAGGLPPGGTGDCALPKLLQYAYCQRPEAPPFRGILVWGDG